MHGHPARARSRRRALARVRDDLGERLAATVVGNPDEGRRAHGTRGHRSGSTATSWRASAASPRTAASSVGSADRVDGLGAPARQGLLRRSHAARGRDRAPPLPPSTPSRSSGRWRRSCPGRARPRRRPRSSPAARAASSPPSIRRMPPSRARRRAGPRPVPRPRLPGQREDRRAVARGRAPSFPTSSTADPGARAGARSWAGSGASSFYMQRVALEGSRPVIEKIAGTKSG